MIVIGVIQVIFHYKCMTPIKSTRFVCHFPMCSADIKPHQLLITNERTQFVHTEGIHVTKTDLLVQLD